MTEFTISNSVSPLMLPHFASDGDTGCLIRIYPADEPGGIWQLEDDNCVIGRVADSDIQVLDDSVSRHHAAIRRLEGGYVLTDLGSTNGTFVNDERVMDRQLQAEDRIRIGHQIFKFLAADHIEVQYHNTLYRMVTTDGLTQAHNRQYMDETLEREFTRSCRRHRPLAVIMMDIDHFKTVNDEHGHLAGDEVLREFSQRVRALLQDEFFCRFGGEEFAVLAGECDLETAAQLAETIRATVAAEPFETSDGPLDITVSIGVVEAQTEACDKAVELLAAADAKLYRAKEGGRNQVVG